MSIHKRNCFITMVQSWRKFVLIISLTLISAAASRAGRANGHSTEYINNPSKITVKFEENIRDNIQKRMLLIIDDLFAIHQQLLLHYVPVNTSRELKQLQGELSEMKRALQNCDFQVNRTQRRDNATILCGQLSVLLQTVYV